MHTAVGVGVVISVAAATSAVLLLLLVYGEIVAARHLHNIAMHAVSGAACLFIPQQPLAKHVCIHLYTTEDTGL